MGREVRGGAEGLLVAVGGVCEPDVVVCVVDHYIVYGVEGTAVEVGYEGFGGLGHGVHEDEAGWSGLVALAAVEDVVFVVAGAVCLYDVRVGELAYGVRSVVLDAVQVDRVAGLEVGGEVDLVGSFDVDACFVGELVLAGLDLCQFGSCDEVCKSGVVDCESLVPLSDGFGVGDIFGCSFEVHGNSLGVQGHWSAFSVLVGVAVAL